MILAKRASRGGGNAAHGKPWDLLSSDLWVRVAQLCPITHQPVWMACPFADWLVIAAKSFREQVLRAESAAAEFRAQQVREGVAECDFDDEELARRLVAEKFGLKDVESKFGCLGDRNYNAFGLFSAGMRWRSQAKQLGCMREGWPKNRSQFVGFEGGFMSDDNPDIHSHCFCTLDGLFSVDWDVDSASEHRNGFHLRPKGPVEFVQSAASIQASLQKMLESEECKDDQVRAQLVRGAEARAAELHSDEGTANREDLHAFDAFEDAQWGWGSLFVRPPVPPQTRGEVLDRFGTIKEHLKALEGLITEADNDPADFRLLVAFDN